MCIRDRFPDDRRGGHTGDGRLAFPMIGGFRIFSQRHFHRKRRLEHHVVDAAAVGFHGNRLSADGIGAARPRDDGGHARFERFPETAVLGIDRVHRPQMCIRDRL